MLEEQRSEAGEAVTELILDVFRLNGRLQIAGDRLVSGLGLTSARWQILGAIAYAEKAETVAWHARNMGVHRQGIQRIVNELKREGIVEFQPNPHHKRAQLVVMTPKGRDLYDAAIAMQIPWVNALATDLSPEEIAAAQKVIGQLKARLEEAPTSQDDSSSRS
ncbi:MarR family transcriptional regulator [Leisingera sp. SS27]|uniref:MarR family winged helix-turn-helix transcriptional regulator n=1 Tax=Leisingera sp. SS27 TaxID=2979462 RepID=UPI00232AFFED|nr:MarR family transcriptional regulator [Leisingera sp. SS27]MDC0657727.1 MarR family transcriptional regulator [Leisingera sp. SS27]